MGRLDLVAGEDMEEWVAAHSADTVECMELDVRSRGTVFEQNYVVGGLSAELAAVGLVHELMWQDLVMVLQVSQQVLISLEAEEVRWVSQNCVHCTRLVLEEVLGLLRQLHLLKMQRGLSADQLARHLDRAGARLAAVAAGVEKEIGMSFESHHVGGER